MNKKERVQFIMDELEKLYPKPGIPLDHTDPFTLLVAVMLSAQTTDKKVNEVTPELFARANNPKAMRLLEVDEIKEYIKQIRLSNTKAKNLKKLSQIIHEKHNGIVPQTFEELEALPGVGHKTASVVLAQAFDIPRSEERRVGKECRSRWTRNLQRKKQSEVWSVQTWG